MVKIERECEIAHMMYTLLLRGHFPWYRWRSLIEVPLYLEQESDKRSISFVSHPQIPLQKASVFLCTGSQRFPLAIDLKLLSLPNGTHNLKPDSDTNLNDPPPLVDHSDCNLILVCSLNGMENRIFDHNYHKI